MGYFQITTVEIPDDIIREILSHLHVKSLIRFSAVCKSWRHLICRDQSFIKYQMHQAIKRGHYSTELIMYSEETDELILDADFEEQVVKLKNRGLCNPLALENDLIFAGCCNGVLCLVKGNLVAFESRIYLWNPALHQCRTLPLSQHSFVTSCDFVALVYDSLDDDYIVVRLGCSVDSTDEFELYSLKRNCWRTVLSPVKFTPRFNHCNYFVEWNGKPHWPSEGLQNEDKTSLIVFDGERAGYREIQIPESVPDGDYEGLGIFRGCLSLFVHVNEVGYVIWSMEDDGISTTWKMIFVFQDVHRISEIGYSFLLDITRSGKLLVECDPGYALYDPDKKSVQKLELHPVVEDGHLNTYLYFTMDYVETMVNILPHEENVIKTMVNPLSNYQDGSNDKGEIGKQSTLQSLLVRFGCLIRALFKFRA